jgi:hypothetical protein
VAVQARQLLEQEALEVVALEQLETAMERQELPTPGAVGAVQEITQEPVETGAMAALAWSLLRYQALTQPLSLAA